MNLYDQDEFYRLCNQVVDYLEQWPTLSSEQKEEAVRIEVAMREYEAGPVPHYPDCLPNGQRDMRGWNLQFRRKLLDRHPATAGHAAQARAELAALVQHRREVAK